jgi:putative colanic acid biosynthesis acetyltransferase WcaF
VEILWYFAASRIVKSELLPISALKCAVLRLFGARIGKGVYIKPGFHVKFPWYLEIGDHSWIGERSWIDNLAQVTIGSHVCVSQDVYFCTGNHDWSHPNMRLFHAPITLEKGSWLAARSTIGPGVTLGECSIAGCGSVVLKDIPAYEIHGGNPAAFIRKRRFKDSLNAVECNDLLSMDIGRMAGVSGDRF